MTARSLFLTKAWTDTASQCHKFVHTRRVRLAGDDIYLGELNWGGLKKWRLYGEFDNDVEPKLEQLFQLAQAERVFLVESNFNMSRWQCRDVLQRHARITMNFGTYIVSLEPAEPEIWSKVHSHHRRAIRGAEKRGVEVQFELDLRQFKDLLDQTFAKGDKQNKYGLKCLTAIQQNLAGHVLLAGAYHAGTLQAGLIVPFDDVRGYFLHAAMLPGGTPGASNLLHWEMIKALKSKGIAEYDLGGARRETDDPRLQGIFKFKERFGGDFLDCYYWEKVLDNRAYTAYNILMRLRNVLAGHR